MKRKFIALATVLIILCTFTAQAFAATSPETNAYTYEEYYAAIQECFASYGIVWEGPTRCCCFDKFIYENISYIN